MTSPNLTPFQEINPSTGARLSKHRSHCWQSIIAFLCALIPAAAEGVEPLPSYSRAAALRTDSTLRAVAFADERRGVAVGDRGTILQTSDGGALWELRESGVDCPLLDLVWLDQQHVVAVGGAHDRVTGISRGVVVASLDGGKRWQRADDENLPRLIRIARQPGGRRLMAAGDWSPSDRARGFESQDGGKTWQSEPLPDAFTATTSEPSSATRRDWGRLCHAFAPVRGRCRAGDSHFWAVGDHGTIIFSPDRGRSWELRRGRDRRTAVLVISSNVNAIPWPLVASESLEFASRTALLVLDDKSTQGDSSAASAMIQQAALALGAMTADLVPNSVDPQQAVDDWLAMHQPAAVVLDRSLPESIRRAVLAAAVDRGIRRVVSYALSGHGESRIHVNAMFPRVGMLARDLWQDALLHVTPYRSLPEGVSLWWEYDSVGMPARGESVSSGIALEPGRRFAGELPSASRRQLQISQARLSQSAQLDRLFETSASPEAFAAGLQTLLAQSAAEDRFRLAWSTLLEARLRGEIDVEAMVLEAISRMAGTASIAAWANLRSEALRESDELRKLRSLKVGLTSDGRDLQAFNSEPVHVSPFQIDRGGQSASGAGNAGSLRVRPAGITQPGTIARVAANAPVIVPDNQPLEISATNVETLRRERSRRENSVDLAWEFHPLVLIARDAQRRRGEDGVLQPQEGPSAALQRLANDRNATGWPHLLESPHHPPLVIRHATAPPKLDNRFDDSCWQNADSSAPTRVLHYGDRLSCQFAYDDEYIYLSVRCLDGILHEDSQSPERSMRQRDHDLSAVDRLQLKIDTDRDLLTAYSLEVTTSGRTRDRIEGDPSWQPTWYVAAASERSDCSFEIAILRRDLFELPTRPGQSWYVSLRPLHGRRSAELEAPIPSPEQWTRIVFE